MATLDQRAQGASWWVKAPMPKHWQGIVRALGMRRNMTLEEVVKEALREWSGKRGETLTESDDTAQDEELDEAS